MPNEKDRTQKFGETLHHPKDTLPPDGIGAASTDGDKTQGYVYATYQGEKAGDSVDRGLIPGFEILDELGRGAFGVVYRARDIRLDRLVAIKISLIDDPRLREQYIKEAKNSAKLECPGIVPVYQVGTLDNGRPFVVQRLIDGGTLGKLLSQSGPLELQQACAMMIEIARAVGKAHSAGIVHRDIKPDNILVDTQGKPWLADFGLALPESEQRKHRGEKAGTPLYMSPEQLLGRADWLDGRSDIYALGVMLYEMLTGRMPFEARDFNELRDQILNREPKPISQRSPEIPAVMDVIFENCSAKRVQDRYSNAFELAADLEAALVDVPLVDTRISGQPRNMSTREITRRTTQRNSLSSRREALMQSQQVAPKRNLLMPVFAIGCLLLAVGGMIYGYAASIGKPRIVPPVTLSPEPASEDVPDVNANPKEPEGPRQLVVSPTGNGTHKTIQSAIDDAEDGEDVMIQPGSYAESIKLVRNVNLVAEQLGEVRLVGDEKAVLELASGATVNLKNLSIEARRKGTDYNAIEVQSGNLVIDKCNFTSDSWDCIKVHPGSSLIVRESTFLSASAPAIEVDSATTFEVDGCEFNVQPPTKQGKAGKSAGIQAKNTAGKISRSQVRGKGEAENGIAWQNTAQLVQIEDCNIVKFRTGIFLRNCNDVRVNDRRKVDRTSPMISGCDQGIVLLAATAQITDAEIAGNEGNAGIRFESDANKSSSATLLRTEVSGFYHGISNFQSQVVLNDCDVADNMVGILVNNPLSGNPVLSGLSMGFELNNSRVSGSEGPGLWLSAGEATVRNSVFDSNVAGMLVQNDDRAKDKNEYPVRLKLEGVKIRLSQIEAIQIMRPCTYEGADAELEAVMMIAPELTKYSSDGVTYVKRR